jgi:hypothetical protein
VTTNFTVTPINLPAFKCSVVNNNYGSFFGVGQSVPINLDFGNVSRNAPVDWQDARYDVTLTGPTTVTYPDLTPTATSGLVIPAPPQSGVYSYQCAFKGTPLYNPATSAVNTELTISLMHPLGKVQLFTNPTTLVAGQPADMEVVFHAAAGGPMPATYFSIDLIGGGSYFYTALTPIAPGGDTLVHLGSLPNMHGITNVRVDYPGDPYYAPAGVLFPLTNPPIRGTGGSSGGGSGPSSTATAGPRPTVTGSAAAVATAAAQQTPMPLTTDQHGAYATTMPWYQRGGALWWIVLAALVVLAGAGGGALWLRQRGKPAPVAAPPADGDPVPPSDPAS